MKFFYCIFSFIIFSFTTVKSFAQFVTAKVVEESGCLPVKVASFDNFEMLSQHWQVPESLLKKVNKGLTLEKGNPAWVHMPLAGKLLVTPCEGCSTVVHKVAKGEGLYRIGLWYGNIKTVDLRKMNNLRSDALQPGEELIVGYLSFADQNGRYAEEVSNIANSSKPGTTMTVVDMKEIKEDATKSDEKNEKPVIEVVKPILTFKGEGVFSFEYKEDNVKIVKKNMMAATFKSESGWEDGRFYLLSNSIRSGVVVKVRNPDNGTYLYAKVVGPMPDIKQNAGLHLRLNNAGAAKLGFLHEDEVHDLELTY